MKKVLIITYYWPPAGGPGVQRVLKFVKYLREYNWLPYILTAQNGEFPAIDSNLVKDIPKDIQVFKSFNPEPALLYKLLTGRKTNLNIPTYILNDDTNDSFKEKAAKWIRANIFIPDAKVGWYFSSIRQAMKIIKTNQIDLIFSSSPPQTVHLIARKLSKKSGIPWVADFRDPWTDAFWLKDISRNYLSSTIDRWLEKNVLNKANAIVTVSRDFVKLFSAKSNNTYHVIPNGFDEDDFNEIKKKRSNKFRIRYVGTLSKSQKITNFLEALIKCDASCLNKIDVKFIGDIHPAIIKEIKEFHLEKIIKIIDYIPHQDMIGEIVNAEILLLVIPDSPKNQGIIPGKLFEYIATYNYILGIGPPENNAVNILNQTGTGAMFNFKTDLYDLLHEQFSNWIANKRNVVSKAKIMNFSRKNQTHELSRIFNKVVTE